MESTVERPSFVTDDHLEYLDLLRESGATNMLGARPYLKKEFKIKDDDQAAAILTYWMKSFSERQHGN